MKNPTSLEQYIAKFPKSRALYERANGIFVRGVTHDTRYVRPFPIFITHAKGSQKWDVDGYKYIDYFGGHGGLMLGHAHPSLIKAVNEQIEKGTHYGASQELEIEWAELIRQLVPSAERVEFTNSGTEANMMGIRVARAFSGRSKIVRFQEQFAGLYDAVTKGIVPPWDIPASGGILPCDVENTIVIPCNDEQALEEVLSKGDVALVMLEPLGSFSGVTGVVPSFHKTLWDLTRKYDTLLLYDEVITGFRVSPGGVQAEVGVTPDLTALGKNVTGGMPGAGAIVGRADVMDVFDYKDAEWNRYKRVFHPGTFNGNPLCSATGVATLKILATGEPQKTANDMGARLRKGMQQVLDERHVAGCAYGEYSTFHIFWGECAMRNKCNKEICLNADKISKDVGYSLHINLALNGVHTVNLAWEGFTTAVHTEQDIDKTIKAFDISIDTMGKEGIFK